MDLKKKITDEAGRILYAEDQNGEVVVNVEKEKKEMKKEARAETLADLYEMGQLDQQTIDKIKESRPEVYQKAKGIVQNRG